jgi:hypothetical protein
MHHCFDKISCGVVQYEQATGFLVHLSFALGGMSVVLQFCDTSTGQQIELSVASSGLDLLEKNDRTLCCWCLNSSVGVPQQEMAH